MAGRQSRKQSPADAVLFMVVLPGIEQGVDYHVARGIVGTRYQCGCRLMMGVSQRWERSVSGAGHSFYLFVRKIVKC